MDSRAGSFQIEIDGRLCKGTEGCRICISLCPREVLARGDRLTPRGTHMASVVAADRCTGCELCTLYCPDLAIVVTRTGCEHPCGFATGEESG